MCFLDVCMFSELLVVDRGPDFQLERCVWFCVENFIMKKFEISIAGFSLCSRDLI